MLPLEKGCNEALRENAKTYFSKISLGSRELSRALSRIMSSANSTLVSRRHKVVDHLKFAFAGTNLLLNSLFPFLLPPAVLNDDRATLDDFYRTCLPMWA